MTSSVHSVVRGGSPLNLVHGAILFPLGCSLFFLSILLSCLFLQHRIVSLAMEQVVETVSAAAAAGTHERGVLALYPWPEQTNVRLAQNGIRGLLTSPARTVQRRRLLVRATGPYREDSKFYLLEVEVATLTAEEHATLTQLVQPQPCNDERRCACWIPGACLSTIQWGTSSGGASGDEPSSPLSTLQPASAMMLLPRLALCAGIAARCHGRTRYGTQLREAASQLEELSVATRGIVSDRTLKRLASSFKMNSVSPKKQRHA